MKRGKYIVMLTAVCMWFCLSAYSQDQRIVDSLLRIEKKLSDDTVKFKVIEKLVEQYLDNDVDKAVSYAQQLYKLAQHLDKPRYTIQALFILGNAVYLKNDYGAASENYFAALKISESIKSAADIARCYNYIGKLYYAQNDADNALIYFKKSLILHQQLNIRKEMVTNYIHIGVIHNRKKQYEEAIKNFQKALELQIEDNDIKNIAVTYLNIAVAYHYVKKSNLAIENARKAVEAAEKAGNRRYITIAYLNLGGLYATAKQYDEALGAYNTALENSSKSGHNNLAGIYSSIAGIYAEQKQFAKAYQYTEQALLEKDSMYKEQNNRQANELLAKHEAEQREENINSLKQDTALSEEQYKKERHLRIYISIFGVLGAAFAFVLGRRIIQTRRINKTLKATHQQIENKSRSIMDNISYSKRIQDAMLPSIPAMQQLFNELFVLFLPKDIVSGDFYWSAEVNGRKLIACCDCTGHGVPGALMSMICNNILNHVVIEDEITSPDQILNKVHLGVRKALKQDKQHRSMDGMDVALISLYTESDNYYLQYAGANRPLWIITKGDDGNPLLIETKPDKHSIGGYQTEEQRIFTLHTIPIKKGDCIYMTSDGYADQFGGKEGKKLMTKRFKDLLLQNHKSAMVQQKLVLFETYDTWKANYEQVDDVLVIGIRIPE